MFYIWFLIAAFLGILEALTTNLVSIWFVISSLVTMIISLFTDNLYIQIGTFVTLGILLMPITKKIYKKIKLDNISTNFDRIIGMKGIVTEDITKDNIGEVKVDGKLWSAYADMDISKGEIVKILSINSVKIKVEKWEEK
ncbi:MAG: NfeD family protein [Bacilli bacterium]|nr:NfeD family protein [Bacilli bacterium]